MSTDSLAHLLYPRMDPGTYNLRNELQISLHIYCTTWESLQLSIGLTADC